MQLSNMTRIFFAIQAPAYSSAILTCLAFLSSVALCTAQLETEAEEAFERGDYFTATDAYLQLLETDPDNAEYNARIGRGYLRTYTQPLSALEYLLRAESLTKRPKDLYLDIATAYSFHLDYDQALYYLQRLEEEGGVNKKNRDQVHKMRLDYLAAAELLKYPTDVSFENLGGGVNSAYPDYHPFVTRDSDRLFFASRRRMKPGDKPEFDGYFPSDIFIADREEDGFTARPINDPVNTAYDEQVVGITDSGDSLFIYIDHVTNYGDIHLSTRNGAVYQRPRPLDKTVNSPAVESSCSISHDGNTIFFSSDRLGGSGGLDLWKITKNADGNWSAAVNLGEEVNTPFDEDFPNLSADGQSLFFTSNGHPGMGGFDLFFSALDPQTGQWTAPQNAGFPLNTPFDDKSISFSGRGRHAYITAIRPEGLGDLDIYRITFNEGVDDTEPAIFSVHIADIDDPERAPELMVENAEGKLIGKYRPHRLTNRYVFALYPGKYVLKTHATGYQPYAQTLIVNKSHLQQDRNVKIINLSNE